jgi:AcrR family transcriptional regulator
MTEENGHPAARRGRPRSTGDAERRQAILQAAHEAFVELGFAGTTTAIVAARAKVSKRTIYESFADKTALFAAVIREHQHLILDLPRPPDENLPLLDTMIRLFRLDIDDDAERSREAILNLMTKESVLFPELSDYLYETEAIRSREALIDWLQEEASRGRIVVEDPAVYAGMLMDIVFGALLPRRRLQRAPDRALRREHIKKRLEIFLRGIHAGGVAPRP